MAIPVYNLAIGSFSQCRIITTYASTSWIMPSTAFKEALGFVLWSIRAKRCCILYLRSSMRFCETISMIPRIKGKQFNSLARINQSNEKLLVSFTSFTRSVTGESSNIPLYSKQFLPQDHCLFPQTGCVHIAVAQAPPYEAGVSNSRTK